MTTQRAPIRVPGLLLAGMLLVVGSALAFEHLGGYAPCALCLEQRTPYYIGIPILAVALLASCLKAPRAVLTTGLIIAILCLLATLALGAYHAGVEWQFWPGPASCTAGITGNASDAGSLLSSLSEAKPPSCTDAAGRFLGLSFAGWNVLAALALMIVAVSELRQTHHGSSGMSQ